MFCVYFINALKQPIYNLLNQVEKHKQTSGQQQQIVQRFPLLKTLSPDEIGWDEE